jgi:uncharacterized protein (TIGR03067 family)
MKERWMVVGTLALLVVAGQLLADNEKQGKDAPKTTKYKYLSATNAGEEIPKKELEDWILTTDGAKGVLKKGDKVLVAANYKIDRTKTPWTIDLTITEGEDKGKVVKGILEVKDGTMRGCFGKPGKDRPTEFSSTKENGYFLEVLQEVK